MKHRIYLASSWRNAHQPAIVQLLREDGHEVYDFRNPAPGNTGFSWTQIDREWQRWDLETYTVNILTHPIAHRAFALDKAGLDWCSMCVLLLPCGRSAHLEAGYACGQGKRTIFYLDEHQFEPELMYLLGTGFAFGPASLLEAVNR